MRVKSYDDLNLSRAFVVQFLASWYNMSPNWASEWKVMTIWISRELPLFNFDCLDMVCAWIGHATENLWPFAFLKSFSCSISSVSICNVPESDMRVKTYDRLNFSRASAVQFIASRYAMRLNRICEWKVMTIWISRENLLFNFERLDTLCAWIGYASEKLWPFDFSRASIVQFQASRYVMRLNRTCDWKLMTVWISRELLLFNFERLDM